METFSIILSFLVSMFLIYSVVVLLYKDWKDRVHRAYTVISLSGFGIIFTMFLLYTFKESPYLLEINRLTQASFVLFSAGLVNSSLIYPIKLKSSKEANFSQMFLIMVPAIIVSIIIIFTPLNVKSVWFEGGKLERDTGGFYIWYAIVAGIYLIIAVGSFIYQYFKTDVEIYKIQMRYIFISSSTVVVAAVFSVILPEYYNYTDFYVLGPSIAAFFCLGAFFYGIVSYDMMNITTIIRRAFTYLGISLVISLPIYAFIHLYSVNLSTFIKFPQFIIEIFLVFIFIGLTLFLQPAIYNIFERRKYNFETIIDKFLIDIVSEIRDPRKMIEKTVDMLFDNLVLKSAFFINYNNVTKNFDMYYSRGEEFYFEQYENSPAIVDWFLRNHTILQVNRIYTDLNSFKNSRPVFIEFFKKYNIKIILPIYHRKRIMGLLCLGEKVSGTIYKLYEILKLISIRKEINTHISNSLIYKEAMKEELIQRTLDLSTDLIKRSIPISLPSMAGIKFGAFYIPKYKDRMDYFDFIRPGNQGIGIIVTDMQDVGFENAIQSVILRSAFQTSTNEAPSSYSVMQRLNRVLCSYYEEMTNQISAYYLYYDVKSQRLAYTNADFPPLEIFRIETSEFDQMQTEGNPLGVNAETPYDMKRTNMLRGDIGVLCSKALINSKNSEGDMFGINKLRRLVLENKHTDPANIVNVIKSNFSEYIGESPIESSVLLIVFKIV